MPSQKSGTEMPIWLPMRAKWSMGEPRRTADRMPSGKAMSRATTSAARPSEIVAGIRDISELEDALSMRKLTPKSPTAAWLR